MTISKELSGKVKAVSIILIIAAHIFGGQLALMNTQLTSLFGTGGVFCFLFLSGYGLCVSQRNKEISFFEFWSRRINTVFVPYIIVTVLYCIALDILFKTIIPVSIIAKNIVLIDYDRGIDGTMWYLSYLVLWYLAFSVLYSLRISPYVRVFALVCLAYLFFTYHWSFGKCNWQFSVNAFAFPAGVIYAYIAPKVQCKIPMWVKHISVLLCIVLLVYLYIRNGQSSTAYTIRHTLLLIAVVCICAYMEKCVPLSKALGFVGKNSYYLYLIEGKLIIICSRLGLLKNPALYLIIYAVMLIVCAVALKYLLDFLEKASVIV